MDAALAQFQPENPHRPTSRGCGGTQVIRRVRSVLAVSSGPCWAASLRLSFPVLLIRLFSFARAVHSPAHLPIPCPIL